MLLTTTTTTTGRSFDLRPQLGSPPVAKMIRSASGASSSFASASPSAAGGHIDTRFHAVYLLHSLDPTCGRHLYYVGYTTHPPRRLRQHNGECTNGAWRTKRRGRPWTMVMCVSGFTEDRAALRFEWTCQNETTALSIRDDVAANLKGARAAVAGGAAAALTKPQYAVGVFCLALRAAPFRDTPLLLHVIDAARVDAALVACGKRGVTLPPVSELFGVQRTSLEQLTASLAPADVHPHRRRRTDAVVGGEDNSGGHRNASFLDTSSLSCRSNANSSMASEIDAEASTATDRRDGGPEGGASMVSPAAERLLEDAGLLPCTLCDLPVSIARSLVCTRHPSGKCFMRCHLACLALWFLHHAAAAGPRASPAGPSPPPLTDEAASEAAATSCHVDRVSSSQTAPPAGVATPTGESPVASSLFLAASVEPVPTNAAPCPACGTSLRFGVLVHYLRGVLNQRETNVHAERHAMLDRLRSQIATERKAATAGSKRPRSVVSPSETDAVGDLARPSGPAQATGGATAVEGRRLPDDPTGTDGDDDAMWIALCSQR